MTRRYLNATGYFNCNRIAVFHSGQAARSACRVPSQTTSFAAFQPTRRVPPKLPAAARLWAHSQPALGTAAPGTVLRGQGALRRQLRPAELRFHSCYSTVTALPRDAAAAGPPRSSAAAPAAPLGRAAGAEGPTRSLFFAGTAASAQESPLHPSLPTHTPHSPTPVSAPRPLRGSPAAIIAGDSSCRDSLPLPSGAARPGPAATTPPAQVPRGPARRRRAAGGGGRGRSRGDLAS